MRAASILLLLSSSRSETNMDADASSVLCCAVLCCAVLCCAGHGLRDVHQDRVQVQTEVRGAAGKPAVNLQQPVNICRHDVFREYLVKSVVLGSALRHPRCLSCCCPCGLVAASSFALPCPLGSHLRHWCMHALCSISWASWGPGKQASIGIQCGTPPSLSDAPGGRAGRRA